MSQNITIKLSPDSAFNLEAFLEEWNEYGMSQKDTMDAYILKNQKENLTIVFSKDDATNELSFDGYFDHKSIAIFKKLARETNGQLFIEGELEEENDDYLEKWKELRTFQKVLASVVILILLPLVIVIFPILLIWLFIRLIFTLLFHGKRA